MSADTIETTNQRLDREAKEIYDAEFARVEAQLPAFSKLHAEFVADHRIAYNADFEGKVEPVEGMTEDAVIHALQRLHTIREQQVEIERLLDSGYERIESIDKTTRFAHVVLYKPGHYSGGTGLIQKFENSRVCPNEHFRPDYILKPRKRNYGHRVNGAQVLVKK